MAAVTPPLFMTVDSYYTGAHLGLPYRDIMQSGIVGTASLLVAQRGAGANMSVDVAAGACWIKGVDNANTQPNYRCYNDNTVNLAIAAANPSNPRIDVVYANVVDSAFAGVSKLWQLAVATGTAAASPGTPSVPNNSLILGQVAVAAAAGSVVTANITDRRTTAYLNQSYLPVCRVRRNTTQSVTTATWTSCQFNVEDYDAFNFHSLVSNTDRLIPTVAGLYLLTGTMTIQANTTGARLMGLGFNGLGSDNLAGVRCSGLASYDTCLTASAVQYFNGSSDYATMSVYQDSGSTLTMTADNGTASTATRLAMVYLGQV